MTTSKTWTQKNLKKLDLEQPGPWNADAIQLDAEKLLEDQSM